jgi:hypothetical protein
MLEIEGVEQTADVSVIGDEATCERQIRSLFDLGVTDFLARPIGTDDEIRRGLACWARYSVAREALVSWRDVEAVQVGAVRRHDLRDLVLGHFGEDLTDDLRERGNVDSVCGKSEPHINVSTPITSRLRRPMASSWKPAKQLAYQKSDGRPTCP